MKITTWLSCISIGPVSRDEITALQYVEVMQQGRVVALRTSMPGLRCKLPLANSIIDATAQHARALVWTQDSDFENLAGVPYWPVRRS